MTMKQGMSIGKRGILHITSKVVDTFFDEPKWP